MGSMLQPGIDWVCSLGGTNCDEIPTNCSDDPYRVGDFLFGRFAGEARAGSSWSPLLDCNFGGAALFASSRVYEQWSGARTCAAAGNSTRRLNTATLLDVVSSTDLGTSTSNGVELRTNPHNDVVPVTEPPLVSMSFLGLGGNT